jgi:low temperature requirement protein LtrA
MVRLLQYQRETGRTVRSMTRSRAHELLRKPEQPPRATFKELFFDLVFVFAFTQITERLIANVTVHRRTLLSAVGEPLLALLALLMVWFITAWVTDLYDPQRPRVQLVIAGGMIGGLLMAVELPQAFGNWGLAFAGAYVAIHIGRGLVLVPALRGHEAQRRAAGVLLWFSVSALPWIIGAILPESLRGALWTLAIAIDYTGAMLLWPAPWGVRPRWPVSAEYLSERYRQVFIIALGELIVIAGVTYSPKYLTSHGGHTAAFVVSVATTALLERIYTYRAGELLPAAIAAAADPVRLVRRALLAHLLMVIGALAISAGYGLVIEHPAGRTDPVWLTFILGGPALFIVGRAGFEHAVFARVSRDRVIGLLLLIALAPLMRVVPPLAVGTIAMAVLLGIAVADAALGRRHPSDLPSPRAAGPA